MLEARSPLSTITSLVLDLEDVCTTDNTHNTPRAPALGKSLVLLMIACLVLTSLQIKGFVSARFLSQLGPACPKLASLTIVSTDRDLSQLQAAVQHLSRLPRLTSLALPGLQRKLPDMSAIRGLRSFSSEAFSFRSDADWRQLPPHLQHLGCSQLWSGPPATSNSGQALLGSLLSLELVGEYLHMQHCAQLLHAAPLLQELKSSGPCEIPDAVNSTIHCTSPA